MNNLKKNHYENFNIFFLYQNKLGKKCQQLCFLEKKKNPKKHATLGSQRSHINAAIRKENKKSLWIALDSEIHIMNNFKKSTTISL
jgi:hypothetical protein